MSGTLICQRNRIDMRNNNEKIKESNNENENQQTEKKENIDILARARFSFAATQEIPESNNESDEHFHKDADLHHKEYLDNILKEISTLKKNKLKEKSSGFF